MPRMPVLLIVAAAFLAVVVIYLIISGWTDQQKPPDQLPEDHDTMIARRYPLSASFDAIFEKHIAPTADYYFYTKVAGAKFPNADGSRRPPIIKKCEMMELLHLEQEPDNPVDPYAMAVKRFDGSQLGYLEQRVARELHQDAGKPVSWSAVFKHANRHPETEQIVGATIVLVRTKMEA